MSKHCREPIQHTCPDIDRHIKYIQQSIVKVRDLKNMNQQELYSAAADMSTELESCIDYLENLRRSNHELRSWGIEEAERVDELESQLVEI